MAVSLRERPEIIGKDADRLMKKIKLNNKNHSSLVKRIGAKNPNEQRFNVR